MLENKPFYRFLHSCLDRLNEGTINKEALGDLLNNIVNDNYTCPISDKLPIEVSLILSDTTASVFSSDALSK